MPAPVTAAEVLDLVQKSGLVEEPKLRAYIQKLNESGPLPEDPTKLAQTLVRDALLTYFQAEQLLQGKYKRFSLGKYKVLEKLGAGGMGTVFLCEHKLMRRRVAVKVLPIPKAEDKASLDRFYREARAVAAVDHPNIVRAYDIDQDDNLHFLVMEWVDGTNLHDIVKKFGPLDIVRACHYIYGAAVGLQHAHEIGIIHRDIKPGNILIDRSGMVKILDLGLARFFNDEDDQLTRQNDENVLGTADYLAPEQALDSHLVDIRADIYSLGATFYYLLTGSAPFPEGSVAQKLIWHQNRPPRPIKSLRAEVPDELVAVIDKMMAKDPAKRYQVPAELMADLTRWVAMPIAPPDEREMPALAPIVAHSISGRVASTLVGGSVPGGVLRTVASPSVGALLLPPVTPGNMSPVTPSPDSAGDPNGGNLPVVWSNLDYDTQSTAQGDTETPEPAEVQPQKERPSRVRRQYQSSGDVAAKKSGKRSVVIGIVVFSAIAVAVYFGFIKTAEVDPPPPPPNPSGSRRIVVSKTPGENTFANLQLALRNAKIGDTIVIAEPTLVEQAIILKPDQHKNLTIESATALGKPAVIEFSAKGGGTMFFARQVEGFRLRNVEFDGKEQAECGIRLLGNLSGATIENVIVRNLKTGFHIWNATGTAGKPVMLDRVRVVLNPTSEVGVFVEADERNNNRLVTIKNSRFEGPGGDQAKQVGIRIEGQVLDLDVQNNRFYNLNSGVMFAKPLDVVSKGSFTNNTFYQMSLGFHFNFGPKEPAKYEVKLAQNYFGKTKELMKTPGPITGLTSADNIHDAASKQGNLPLAATKLDAPTLPEPNPNDDSDFLRFPANPPMAGGNRVGAQ